MALLTNISAGISYPEAAADLITAFDAIRGGGGEVFAAGGYIRAVENCRPALLAVEVAHFYLLLLCGFAYRTGLFLLLPLVLLRELFLRFMAKIRCGPFPAVSSAHGCVCSGLKNTHNAKFFKPYCFPSAHLLQ